METIPLHCFIGPNNLSITIPTKELIELLEFKLSALKEAREKDSSWNYPIEETEADIIYLKDKIKD